MTTYHTRSKETADPETHLALFGTNNQRYET